MRSMGQLVTLFLSGMFFANGVPHFVHGISGEAFHNPFLHRFVPSVPSPLFNVVWGLLSFGLAIALGSRSDGLAWGLHAHGIAWGAGFVFAAVGLSLYFRAR